MSEVPPTQPEPTPEPTPEPVAAAEVTPPAEPTPPVEPAPFSAPALGAGPSAEEKNHAMLAWFLSIITYFIVPLIFFLTATDKPFVKRHAGMALGFQICLIVASIVAGILTFVFVGFLLFPLIGVANIAIGIMGGLAAKDGKEYEVPVVGPFIRKTLNI
jgi:uncharacterized Tic20 family protein